MRQMIRVTALAAALSMFGTAACSMNNKVCTLLGCGSEGVQIAFTYKDPGSYLVDVTVDGVKTTCATTIPLQKGSTGTDACIAARIYLTEVGSELPIAEQSIGGLTIETTTAKSVAVRVTRDGKLLDETTFAPSYVVATGPNGPDCEPKACTSAKHALP